MLLIIFFQLLSIFLITLQIISRKTNVLGAKTSIVPLKKAEFIFTQNKFKYFYELKPDNIWHENQPGLNKEVTYTINSDGFNERFNYPTEKKENSYRIITLGDSHTFGQFVNTSDNWPEKLEDILNNKCTPNKKIEIINLGVPGYDIAYSLERLKKGGLKYNPDLIIWFLKNDDFQEYNDIFKPVIEKYRKQLISNRVNLPLARYPEVGLALKEINESYGEANILKLQISTLDEVLKMNSKFLLIDYPDTADIYKNIMRQLADQKRNVYFYDKLPISYFSEYRFPDGHPNEQAYKLVSEDLAKLLSENFIDCIKN